REEVPAKGPQVLAVHFLEESQSLLRPVEPHLSHAEEGQNLLHGLIAIGQRGEVSKRPVGIAERWRPQQEQTRETAGGGERDGREDRGQSQVVTSGPQIMVAAVIARAKAE